MQLTSVIQFRRGSWAWADSLLAVLATTGPLLLFFWLDGAQSGLTALCGGFASLYGLGEPLFRRLSIVGGAGAGMTAVIVMCSLLEPSPLAAGLALAVTAAIATYVIDISAAGQPGMIMFLVTGSVALGLPAASDGVVHRGLVTAAGATIAVVAALSLLALQPVAPKPAAAKPGVTSARNHALWMGVATFTTATLVIAADVPHWQWAPMSTAAVLQSTDTPTIFARAVQRSAGTIVGVLITAGLLLAQPAFVGTVLLCSLCLGASQLLFPRNYALGIVSITPLAFLLPGLIHPAGDTSSLLQRVWATAFGAMLGVLMWYVARRRLSRW
jgi:hypothetical protein